jgi:hypothetical protein
VVDRHLRSLPPRDPDATLSAGTSVAAHTRDGAEPPQRASWGSGQGGTG